MTDPPYQNVDAWSEEPYEDVDVEDLPQWWQDCLAEFEAHGLHRYVPAQFSDGTVVHEFVKHLESQYSVDIQLLRVGGSPGDEWTVRVDGESVGTLPRSRVRQKFSLVEVDSETFHDLIRSSL